MFFVVLFLGYVGFFLGGFDDLKWGEVEDRRLDFFKVSFVFCCMIMLGYFCVINEGICMIVFMEVIEGEDFRVFVGSWVC